MPRPRRLDRQRIAQPLSEGWWLWLCGIKSWEDLVDEGFDESLDIFIAEGDEQHEAQLWPEYRDQVLAYVAEVTPGRRPPAWWRHEAPEPRRQVSGRMVKRFIEPAKHSPTDPDWNTWKNCQRFEGHWVEEPDPEDPPRYESQPSYLKRLGLLLPGEAARLKRADFQPVDRKD